MKRILTYLVIDDFSKFSTVLPFLSKIYQSNEILLKKIWISKQENESLFHRIFKYCLFWTDGNKTFDFKIFHDLKSTVIEFFPDSNEKNEILSGKNQKGVICWWLWRHFEQLPENWQKELSNLMSLEINESLKSSNFQFENYSVEEQAEIYLKNFVINLRSIFMSENSMFECQKYFDMVEKSFEGNEEMLKKVFLTFDSVFKFNLFHFVYYIQSVEIFDFIVEKYQKLFSEDRNQIKILLKQKNFYEDSPFIVVSKSCKNLNVFQSFYNFVSKFFDEKGEFENILMERNMHLFTALQVAAWNSNVEVFFFLVKKYEQKFNIRDIFMNAHVKTNVWHGFFITNFLEQSTKENAKKIVQYLLELFCEREMMRNFLLMKKGIATIFDNQIVRKNEENQNLLMPLMKHAFNDEEIQELLNNKN
jgi:hypothetical protein